MKNFNFILFILFIYSLNSCSYITGPDGFFPETKNDFFNEKLSEDLDLPESQNTVIKKDDHYPPIISNDKLVETQNIPAPRQIFSSGESNEIQLRRLGELMWVYVETLPSTSWPITKNYFEALSLNIIDANPDTGVMLVEFSDDINFKVTVEHGIKEASTEIFLSTLSPKSSEALEQDSDLIQNQLSDIVKFFASSVSSFSGTSLAAQNLNDQKKTKIFNLNDQTIIELNLGFDRAWSAVSRALDAGKITANDIDRDNGLFFVSYAMEKEEEGWFAFLNFNNDESNNSLMLGEEAEFKIKLEVFDGKTNIYVEALGGSKEEAEALISKINELLS
tara:strand:- start:677 stop:1678 length:1002 start_codon:yes stop_codon:yes gene_type:complete